MSKFRDSVSNLIIGNTSIPIRIKIGNNVNMRVNKQPLKVKVSDNHSFKSWQEVALYLLR